MWRSDCVALPKITDAHAHATAKVNKCVLRSPVLVRFLIQNNFPEKKMLSHGIFAMFMKTSSSSLPREEVVNNLNGCLMTLLGGGGGWGCLISKSSSTT